MIRGLERQLEKHGPFFSSFPNEFSRRYIELGSLYCNSGELRQARAAFRKAIRLAPFRPKPYRYFVLSLLGSRVFRGVQGLASTSLFGRDRIPPTPPLEPKGVQ
jgi:hypothetical protein